jgi:hypothetical protein
MIPVLDILSNRNCISTSLNRLKNVSSTQTLDVIGTLTESKHLLFE